MKNTKDGTNLKFSRLAGIGLPVPGRVTSTPLTTQSFIPWDGDGVAIPTKNDYPQILANLAANCPTHGSAIQKKGKLTYGQGIDFDLLPDEVSNFMKNVNSKNQSINDVIYGLGFDLVTFGGMAIKVHWNFNKTIASVEHIPFKNVRLGEMDDEGDILNYVICNDFGNILERKYQKAYTINRFDSNKIEEGQIVDGEILASDETLENGTQLIYYKTYSTSDNGFYPTPDYIHGLDSAWTELNSGISMNNQIRNGINGAYIISTVDTIVDDESKQGMIDDLSNRLSGSENAGTIAMIPVPVKIDKIEALDNSHYVECNLEIRQRLITAHGIPSILLEYNFGSGFSSRADEMTVALEQFQQMTILGYQQQITRVLNGILDFITTKPYDLQIIPFKIEYDNAEKTKNIEVQDSTSSTVETK